MSNSKLPSRPCVRVVIVKDKKICLCEKLNEEGILTNYVFPGGGIELNQSHEMAVEAECLEEVGIAVTDIISLEMEDEQRGDFFYGKRAKQFAGIVNYYYIARSKKEDRRVYNSEGDSMKYQWLEISEAIDKIRKGPSSIFNEKRIEALVTAAAVLNKQTKNPLYFNW